MSKIKYEVPEPTLRRLPWYLAFAQLFKKEGNANISSTQIAISLDIDPSKVAKDLSFINISGKTRVGYDLEEFTKVLERFLGFKQAHNAFMFGVGSLGGALLQDNGLSNYGLDVVAGFDVKSELIGTSINNIPIYHVESCANLKQKLDVDIGILTVPIDKAQEVADMMVAGGIKAIWNFTPFRIRVPENVVVQNTSIYAHLAVMYNRLNEQLEKDKISVE